MKEEKLKKLIKKKYDKDPSPTGCECLLNLNEQSPELLEEVELGENVK